MQAATGFLMADQVAPAVEILSSMRESAPTEMAAKISVMLRELGAISEDASAAAGRTPATSQSEPAVEPAAQIRALVGPLASSEVELVVRPAVPLLSDTSCVTPIPDEEVTGPRSDMAFISTVSIFAMYQRDLARSATRPESLPAPQPAPVPQTPPVATPLAPVAVAPPPEPPRNSAPGGPAILPPVRGKPGAAGKGQEQPVSLVSTPAGAAVLVDGDPALRCLAPCELRLAPGRHSLLATLAGHHDEPRILNVDKGKPLSIDLPLRAKMGYVKVETETPGVAIYVNGKPAGKVTPAQLPLAEGQYEVGVEIDGQMRTAKVSVMYEQITTIKW